MSENKNLEQISELLTKPFSKLILSNKVDKSFAYNKAIITPVKIHDKDVWQMTRYTDKQAFQENISSSQDLINKIQDLFTHKYKQLNYFGANEDIELKISKKDKLLVSKHKHANITIEPTEHNRTKKYLINEDDKILPLIDMGVMTTDGKIIHSQYNKFRQINKFLEMVDDTLKNWDKKILLS